MKPDISRLTRHVLVEKPRVTKFQIQWEDEKLMQQMIYNNENEQNSSAQDGMLENGS